MEKKETQMDVMIQETRQYIMDNLTITSMSNEELEDKIEELILKKNKGWILFNRGKGSNGSGNLRFHSWFWYFGFHFIG